MEITFLGTSSDDGSCPTAWSTDRGTFLLQGERVTDPAALAKLRGRQNGIPDHETVVEIPAALLKFLPLSDA